MKEEALKFIDNYSSTYYEKTYEQRYLGHDLCDEKYVSDICIRKRKAIEAVDIALKGMCVKPKWVKIDKKHPLPKFEEVFAFNKEWIDEDFNPKGVRIGFLGEDGFISAVWDSEYDMYGCVHEEGDDYDSSQKQPDGTYKTWYHRHGEAIEGYLPNLPTHFMRITTPNVNVI